MLDNSNGWVGEMSLFRQMPMGKQTLTPAIGVLYYDENFNEYYYGISGNESRRSGLSSYSLAIAGHRMLACPLNTH